MKFLGSKPPSSRVSTLYMRYFEINRIVACWSSNYNNTSNLNLVLLQLETLPHEYLVAFKSSISSINYEINESLITPIR